MYAASPGPQAEARATWRASALVEKPELWCDGSTRLSPRIQSTLSVRHIAEPGTKGGSPAPQKPARSGLEMWKLPRFARKSPDTTLTGGFRHNHCMNKTSPNAVEWFEIPTADFSKSLPFYNRVLGLNLEVKAFGPNQIAIFPHVEPGPGGCLMQGPDMVPSGTGSVVYLPTGNVDTAIAQVEAGGGKVLVPKTQIGPGMGFFARFHDPEGNLVGLCGLT